MEPEEESKDRITAVTKLNNLEERDLVTKIQKMTNNNIATELLKEKSLLHGIKFPKIKYLFREPEISMIELGLVDEFILNIETVPNDFPAIVKYVLKNVIVQHKLFKITIVSTIAACDVLKFYQPYQIWRLSLLAEDPNVVYHPPSPTEEDVFNINIDQYQIHFFRLFLKELKIFKRVYESDVGNYAFSDGRRIIYIDDFGINIISQAI
ncbi:hypothetical protein Dimus_031866 [Dionaea muscipula]